MIEDPYKVLEISRDASKDEIKKAYRRLAKKYHPDLHPNDPVAAEKMNEINTAYDMLNNPDKYKTSNTRSSSYSGSSYGGSAYGGNSYGQSQGSYGGNTGYQNNNYYDFGGFDQFFGFGWNFNPEPSRPTATASDSMDIRRVIELINNRQYANATSILNSIISVNRDARWYYLSSLASYGSGNTIQALEQITKATQMEPQNEEYQRVLRTIKQNGTEYTYAGQGYEQYAKSMGDCCFRFAALNFFCMFCRCC